MATYRSLSPILPFGVSVHLHISQMTIAPIAPTNATSALVADFAGGATSDVEMMIGIGLVKDSDAVFFQYLGDDAEPAALMLQSGKPLTRLSNVVLTGLSVADDIGEFNATKLNVFLESSAGRTVLVTSGLQTIWSQCVITGLMAMFDGEDITCPFNLDTWKGNSKMKPCFAAIRVGQAKMSSTDLYEQLRDARTDGDKTKVMQLMRDSVDIIGHALRGEPVNVLDVTDKPATDIKTVEAPADF